MHAYTCYSSVRPFGVTAIAGLVDKDGPHLYMFEPSGVFWVNWCYFALFVFNNCLFLYIRATRLVPLEREKGSQRLRLKNSIFLPCLVAKLFTKLSEFSINATKIQRTTRISKLKLLGSGQKPAIYINQFPRIC
jgi:hypothetical protein